MNVESYLVIQWADRFSCNMEALEQIVVHESALAPQEAAKDPTLNTCLELFAHPEVIVVNIKTRFIDLNAGLVLCLHRI